MDQFDNYDEMDLSGIAQYLAELSQEGKFPKGVESPGKKIEAFLAEDVDFADNDWLNRIISLQGWLGLNAAIAPSISPNEAAASLLEQISPDPVSACLNHEFDDRPRLSDLGAQHLETWLSRAVAHREAFLESLDDGRGLEEATEDWQLLWSEVSMWAQQPALIKAEVQTLTIKQFSDYAKQGSLDLNPSYQRDSVWSVNDSQTLIDSILRGIPIPSIILTQIEGGDYLQIVDGKQRLTAILRFIGQHPTARAYAKQLGAEEEFDKDHKKFISKHHLKSRDIAKFYMPFRLPFYPAGNPLHNVSRKFYCEVKEERIESGQGNVSIKSIFENALTRYKIPVIVYENTRLQDIHHVFSIYNKQGIKLNAEELRNATFHHLGITKLLLVLSGDRPDVEDLAPYLPQIEKERIAEIGENLRDRSFGTMRFKRTKVLSWMCAIILQEPNRGRDGQFVTPSTASHIDAMLRSISDKQGAHPLYQHTTLVALARDVRKAVDVHAMVEDAWAPKFRNKKGFASRWEELPLVASLIVAFILVAISQEDKLDKHMQIIREFTNDHPGPSKTQNKTQWGYIAEISTGALRLVGTDMDEASRLLVEKYGYSCISCLESIAEAAKAS